jgi:steroid delta-isomerase-like uncharacterized protein
MPDDAKQVVLEYYERLNRRDLAGAGDLFSETCAVTVADSSLDKAAYMQLLDSWLTGFPDLRNAVEDVVADGAVVAVRTSWEGTHGTPFAGIPSTGRRVHYGSFSFTRVEDGRIVERQLLANLFGVLGQLGDLSFRPSREAPSPQAPSRDEEQPPRTLDKDVSDAFRAAPSGE